MKFVLNPLVPFALLSSLFACKFNSSSQSLSAKAIQRFAKVETPHRENLSNRTSFLGYVEPKKFVSLHFVVAGRIESCFVKEGEVVKKGQAICKLDQSAVDLEVARAKNAMEAARKLIETNLADKQKALFEAGVIGQAEFEQVRVQSESARASFQDAKSLHEMALKKQSEYILKAPWDGTVTKLEVKAGQPVSPEIPIAFLSNEEGLLVRSDIHGVHFRNLKVGNFARITSISSKKLTTPIEAYVIEKSPAVSPRTQSFQISFGLKGDVSELLTIGILVTGEVELERLENVLTISQTALNSWSQDGKASVFIMNQKSELELRHIDIGALTDGRVEVKSGLSGDEQVVAEIAPDFIEGLPISPLAESQP